MQFTFKIWGKCNSGVPVVCEQWCDGDLNKNTDFQTKKYIPLNLVKRSCLPTWLENIAFMVSFSFANVS